MRALSSSFVFLLRLRLPASSLPASTLGGSLVYRDHAYDHEHRKFRNWYELVTRRTLLHTKSRRLLTVSPPMLSISPLRYEVTLSTSRICCKRATLLTRLTRRHGVFSYPHLDLGQNSLCLVNNTMSVFSVHRLSFDPASTADQLLSRKYFRTIPQFIKDDSSSRCVKDIPQV